MKRAAPNLYEYDDYRLFLRDWLTSKRGKSWRWFADKAGFRGHNTVALVVAGKRNLSIASATKCAAVLELNDDQGRYFEDLVRFNQTKEIRERVALYARIVEHPKRQKIAPLDHGKLKFFRHWLAPVLFEMVQLQNFQPSAKWIAEQFDPPLPLHQVKEMVQDLLSAGLLSESDGLWIQNHEHLATGDGVADVHVYAYHETALAKAADALHDVPDHLRHYHVITSAAPRRVLPELIEISREYEAKMLACIEKAGAEKDDVFQISMQIFSTLNTKKGPSL